MKKILLLTCLLVSTVIMPACWAKQDDAYVQLLHRAITLYRPNNVAEMQEKIKEQKGAFSPQMQEIMEAYTAEHPMFMAELMAPVARQTISQKELKTLLNSLSEPRFRRIIDSVSFVSYHASDIDTVTWNFIYNIPENDPFWDRKMAMRAAYFQLSFTLSLDPHKFDTTFLQMAQLVDSLNWKHANNEEDWIDKYLDYSLNNGTFAHAEQTLITILKISPTLMAYVGELGSDERIGEFAFEYATALALSQLAEYDYVATGDDLDCLIRVTQTPEYGKLRDAFMLFFGQLVSVDRNIWCNCSSGLYDFAVEHFPDYQAEIQQLAAEKQLFCTPDK